MASQPPANLVDGLFGTANNRLLFRTVWADAATYVVGNLLVVNLAGTPGAGCRYTFKKSASADVEPGGVVCAQSITLPAGGGFIQVIAGGKVDATVWGLAASAAISVGERVTSSGTAGAIKKVTTTPAAANQSYGTCVTAFAGGGAADGAVEWECPAFV